MPRVFATHLPIGAAAQLAIPQRLGRIPWAVGRPDSGTASAPRRTETGGLGLGLGLRAGLAEAVLADALVERGPRDPEDLGGALYGPVFLAEDLLDVATLDFVERRRGAGRRGGRSARRGCYRCRRARSTEQVGEVLRQQRRPRAEQRGVLEHVAQLADVARPGMREQRALGGLRELQPGPAQVGG